MAKSKSGSIPGERARTPGSAEGERNPAEQNDRADADIVGHTEDDDEFDEDDDEQEEDDGEDEDL